MSHILTLWSTPLQLIFLGSILSYELHGAGWRDTFDVLDSREGLGGGMYSDLTTGAESNREEMIQQYECIRVVPSFLSYPGVRRRIRNVLGSRDIPVDVNMNSKSPKPSHYHIS